MDADVIIVGAGLAGLSCAFELTKAGRKVRVLEQSKAVGGRVQTDDFEGFRLDHGFQVLLTAYPNCRALLDYSTLDLGQFDPGALLHNADGKTSRVSDPFRRPGETLATLRAPIGSFRDKLLILKLRALLKKGVPPQAEAWIKPSSTEWLLKFGFSEHIINAFFRPFFSGIFLEKNLETSAWMLGYIYSYFTRGYAALPAGGMGRIADQLADRVGRSAIETGVKVTQVSRNSVTTVDGRTLSTSAVVVAVDGDTARTWFPTLPERAWNSAGCFYFDAPESPFGKDRRVWLNATGKGEINQVAVPSDIAGGYAPAGRALISVGTVGKESFDPHAPARIQREAVQYFGESARSWRFLKAYHIPKALPQSTPESLLQNEARPSQIEGIYLCGDHRSVGAIDAAMQGGLDTARAVLAKVFCG